MTRYIPSYRILAASGAGVPETPAPSNRLKIGHFRQRTITYYVKSPLSASKRLKRGSPLKSYKTMELVGKVQEITPIESGTSANGEWQKRNLVIQTLDQNATNVAFSVMNSRLQQVEFLHVNDVIRVRFGVTSHKVNDRWFSDIQLWEVKPV